MKWGKIYICNCLIAIVSLAAFAAAGETSRLSGSYEVIGHSEAAGQTRIQLRLHFVNPGPADLQIRRLSLWDSSHASKGATQSCLLVVRAAGSTDTKQEFTIPREDYQLWRRGARPRLVLKVARPGGRVSNEVIQLDRASGKGN